MKTEYYKSRTVSVLVVAMFILCSAFVAVPGMVDGSDADPGADKAVSDATSFGSDDPASLFDGNRLGDLLGYLVTVNDEGISPLAEVIYNIIHNESFDSMLKDALIDLGLSPMEANNIIVLLKGMPIENIQAVIDTFAAFDYEALFVLLKDVSTGTVSLDDFQKRLAKILDVPVVSIKLVITQERYDALVNLLDLSMGRVYDSFRKAIEIDESKYTNVISKDLTLSDRMVLSNVLVKDGVTITFNSGSSLEVNGELCFEDNVKLKGAPVDITVTPGTDKVSTISFGKVGYSSSSDIVFYSDGDVEISTKTVLLPKEGDVDYSKASFDYNFALKVSENGLKTNIFGGDAFFLGNGKDVSLEVGFKIDMGELLGAIKKTGESSFFLGLVKAISENGFVKLIPTVDPVVSVYDMEFVMGSSVKVKGLSMDDGKLVLDKAEVVSDEGFNMAIEGLDIDLSSSEKLTFELKTLDVNVGEEFSMTIKDVTWKTTVKVYSLVEFFNELITVLENGGTYLDIAELINRSDFFDYGSDMVIGSFSVGMDGLSLCLDKIMVSNELTDMAVFSMIILHVDYRAESDEKVIELSVSDVFLNIRSNYDKIVPLTITLAGVIVFGIGDNPSEVFGSIARYLLQDSSTVLMIDVGSVSLTVTSVDEEGATQSIVLDVDKGIVNHFELKVRSSSKDLVVVDVTSSFKKDGKATIQVTDDRQNFKFTVDKYDTDGEIVISSPDLSKIESKDFPKYLWDSVKIEVLVNIHAMAVNDSGDDRSTVEVYMAATIGKDVVVFEDGKFSIDVAEFYNEFKARSVTFVGTGSSVYTVIFNDVRYSDDGYIARGFSADYGGVRNIMAYDKAPVYSGVFDLDFYLEYVPYGEVSENGFIRVETGDVTLEGKKFADVPGGTVVDLPEVKDPNFIGWDLNGKYVGDVDTITVFGDSVIERSMSQPLVPSADGKMDVTCDAVVFDKDSVSAIKTSDVTLNFVTSGVSLVLSKDTLSKIAGSETAYLSTILGDAGQLTIDPTAPEALEKALKASKVVKINVKSDFTSGFDKVKVVLPYTMAAGAPVEDVHVYYVAADGKLTLMDCEYDGKNVVFYTDHFSDFAVCTYHIPVESESGSDNLIYIVVAVIAVLAIAVVAFLVVRNKRK